MTETLLLSIPNIAVVGTANATEKEADLAEQLGFALRRQETNILCGGRMGVMFYVARGAWKAKASQPSLRGVVVGLLPEKHRQNANPYLDVALPTGIGMLRNGLIAIGCDAMIAIGGGAGTLSEMVMAWHERRPIAVLGSTGWAGQLAGKCLDQRSSEPIASFSRPRDAAEWAVMVCRSSGRTI